MAERPEFEGRFELGGATLREHTARGVLVNAAFQVGFAALGLLQRVGIAAFLSTTEYGVWGLIVGTLLSISWLKQVGISERYVQQSEADQVLAFQRAFTVELIWTGAFYVLVAAALPVYALLIYDRPEMLVPGYVLSLALLISTLHTPIWVAYRRMAFVRQRLLEGVNPLVGLVVTIALGVAGLGYWAPVIGVVAGFAAGAVAAVATCPYPIRLRIDRATLRDYVGFSWPVLASALGGLVATQSVLIAGNDAVGLAGIGVITIVAAFTSFTDRVDGLISRSIYPAVAAVRDNVAVMRETFVKSNRLALMWGLPFGVALSLFAGDLIAYGLGERWREAEPVMHVVGVAVGLGQIAFNWGVFVQASGRTRPLAVAGGVAVASALLVTVPLMLALGLEGFAAGIALATAAQLLVRAITLNRLFGRFNLAAHSARALAPTVPAVAAVLIARALVTAPRSLAVAVAELVAYCLITAAGTLLFERRLLDEVRGYVRRTSSRESLAPV